MAAFRIQQITIHTGEVWALVRAQETRDGAGGAASRIYPFTSPGAAYLYAVGEGIPVYDPDWVI